MDPTPLPDALQALLRAEAAGTLALQDAENRPLPLLASLDIPVWAHLVDAGDGQTYVHRFAQGRALLEPPYLELLGLTV